MNKKLVLVVGLVAVLSAGIAANTYLTHRNYKQPTPEQVATAKKVQAEAIAEMKEKNRILKQPICNEPITVTIAGITLDMPRGGTTYFVTRGGQEIKYLDHRCEIKRLDDVVFVRWMNMSLTDLSVEGYQSDFRTTYQTNLSQVKEKRSKGLSRILPDGIEEIKTGNYYIFIVPSNLIKTANQEPVMFDCPNMDLGELDGTSNCTTSYLYKNNLAIWYRYFGSRGGAVPNFGLYDQIKADRYHRNLIESWMANEE